MVQQHVLDAIGRWAERATGLRALHARTAAERLAPPYVSLAWRRRPAPKSPPYVVEVAAAPLAGLVTVTAAEGGDAAVVVNLARVRLTRGAGESLDDLAARVAAALAPPLAGRVVVTPAGPDIALAPVVVGDLWRVEAVEGAEAGPTGGTAPARLVDRLWSSTVRVRVVAGRATSGEAGQAGDGAGASELLAALQAALDEPWCQELFDSFGVRRAEEATEAPDEERRVGATLEDRSYFDLVLGVSARYALRAEAATVVSAGVALDQDPPPLEQPLDQVIADG